MTTNNNNPPDTEPPTGDLPEFTDEGAQAWRDVFARIYKVAHDPDSPEDARALWLAYVEGRIDDFSALLKKIQRDEREQRPVPDENNPSSDPAS
jgi:hypothetical protein